MSERQTRISPTDLEVRSGGDGRTVSGIAVPFDEEADIGAYLEVFRRGAFERTIAERGPGRVKFLAAHGRDQALPIGRASVLREDAAGLYGEFKVSKTVAGDEVLELVRDGALDSLSVAFDPVRDRQHGNILERLEVRLLEVSAVAFPAYRGALIGALRSDGREVPPVVTADARRALERLRPPELTTDAARDLLARLKETR